jgi:tryptophanyl-tRNA synthetase
MYILFMKKRVLTGVQATGTLHIGNYFGAIRQMVQHQETSDLFLFIANLHSLTSVSDPKLLRSLTLQAATDLLALGIDPEKSHFWAQSDVPEVTELAWILGCVTPFSLMEKAHSYKDKVAKGIHPSIGLFTYPVLMAADILINQVEVVPVGKDQKQHVEIARDIAIKFNSHYGEIFKIPEPLIPESVATIPGTDGQKMSKSYNNTIPIFGEDSAIKKAVMSIVTDSKGVEEPKDPDTNHIFNIGKHFLTKKEADAWADRFRKGGMGYGDAKKFLLEKILTTFGPFKAKRKNLEANPDEVEKILGDGAMKVRAITLKTLEAVRKATGLRY